MNVTIKTKAGKRPLTDLEKCMLLILKGEDKIFTKKVLKNAQKFKLCAACSDRSEVIYVGEKLIKKNIVKREREGGGYLWWLTEKGKKFAQKIQ